MALLLLGSLNARGLAPGALPARGLALSAGHCLYRLWGGFFFSVKDFVVIFVEFDKCVLDGCFAQVGGGNFTVLKKMD